MQYQVDFCVSGMAMGGDAVAKGRLRSVQAPHERATQVGSLTRTPGPHVGLYKTHSGIKWWSPEELEPLITQIVNEARHESTSFCMGVSEWLRTRGLAELSGDCIWGNPPGAETRRPASFALCRTRRNLCPSCVCA